MGITVWGSGTGIRLFILIQSMPRNATRLNRPARLLNPEKAYFDFLYGEKMLSSDGDELVIRNFRGDYIRFKAVN